ncbi:copper transporter integral membrane protein that functions in high affinity copper transport [Scheffersomyces xylosifermentans]|uniref:copper transporter integral membrane protein that functions in high affinity copper transport n=1 Tax=Scheffersomyces xylosifermentans TaxID=1304137 RepID=UPI00315DF56D
MSGVNYFPELDTSIVSKMSMGGGSGGMGAMGAMEVKRACKISMLWNWNTIDSCFIARSWHVKSKGGFAGSCIGVFFLVLVAQWLHRFCRELQRSFARRHALNRRAAYIADVSQSSEEELEKQKVESYEGGQGDRSEYSSHSTNYFYALSHKWLFQSDPQAIRASPLEHIIISVLFTIEWGLSYIIMLLFMYYNGYIIISCILGALVGKLLFTYNEPLTCNDEEDRKCCK